MFSRFASSLKVKFFVTIFASVFMIITLIFLAELYLVNTYYYDQKIDTLMENTKTLIAEVEEADDEGEMYHLLETYQEENSAYIDYSLIDYYAMEGLSYIYATLLDQYGNFYYMSLETDLLPEQLQEEIIQMRSLSIAGEIYGEELIPYEIQGHSLYTISKQDLSDIINDKDTGVKDQFEVVEVFIEPINYVFEDIYYAEELNQIYDGYNVIEAGEINQDASYTIFETPFSEIKTLVIEYDVEIDGVKKPVRIESSLQSVEDFVEMMKPFVVVFYIIALIITFVIAYILARRVSKPITDITNKANKVSKLEFSEPLNDYGKSELGVLASSINTMSDNLEASMRRLEEANQELLQSLDKERANDSRRREFISNASHEIKTPLGIAKGYVEALKDGIKAEKREQYIDITLDELDRVNKIVLNLLSLMRHEDSEQDLLLKEQSIEPIIDDLLLYFKLMAREKQIQFVKEGHFTKGMIEDKSFKQVLMNLISNAIKYGSADSVITVEGTSNDHQLKIKISNEVDKPDQLDLEKMWYKFYTLDTSHNSQTSGTGLGLPIVKSILERYGSDFGFKLEGSKLTFELTIKQNET